VVAASLQVVFLGLLNIFFYLDKRATVTLLTAAFLLANIAFTFVSLSLGAPYLRLWLALRAARMRADRDGAPGEAAGRSSSTKPSCCNKAAAGPAMRSDVDSAQRARVHVLLMRTACSLLFTFIETAAGLD